MDGFLSPFKKNASLFSIYLANLFLSFHFFLLIYIHSSFLEEFVSQNIVSGLFIGGSIITILLFVFATRIIHSVGALWFLLGSVLLEWISIIALSEMANPLIVGVFFMLHMGFVPMILFSLFLYLESANKDERVTGELRGLYLTLSNITLVISPAIVGWILYKHQFREVFLISSLFLIPLILITWLRLSKITVSAPTHQSFRESWKKARENRNVFFSILLYACLQFFYGWVVIYLPLYLIQEIGFAWSELGILFSIMLLPFVLFELPAGYLADKKYGEKEMIAFGLGLISLTISFLAFPNHKIFSLWALLLFGTRVGAAISEITIESFFFKHVNGRDSGIISLFRMMRPVGYIVAPIVATITFYLVPIRDSFFILGAILLISSTLTLTLEDTL